MSHQALDHTPQRAEASLSQKAAFLRLFKPFSRLSVANLSRFAENTSLLTLNEGDAVDAAAGEPALRGVVEGLVDRIAQGGDAGQLMVESFGPGEMVGLTEAILDHESAPANIVARQNSVLVEFPAALLRTATRQSHALCFEVLAGLIGQPKDNEAGSTVLSPAARIIGYLIDQAGAPASGEARLDPMPRHQVIADACGCSDREAAETIAMLVARDIAHREYPALILSDVAAARAMISTS